MFSFSNFHKLDPAARSVAIEFLHKAQEQPPSFMAFVYRWMAFNGWMSAVTLKNQDREMIDEFVATQRLNDAFDNLMANDPYFHSLVIEFSALWPVLNVRSVRAKLGYNAFRAHDRAELLELCAAANIKQQPVGWDDVDAVSWEQMLRAIYQVRCNLFHGEKSPQNRRDQALVVAADRVLAHYIRTTGCFDWHDI